MSNNKKDPTAEERKKDHIELSFRSQVEESKVDKRFSYEPILNGHPEQTYFPKRSFGGKNMSVPIWVSSMTGGTAKAGLINLNLAKACNEFGLGMGLGSCRSLLYNDEHLKDFQIRKHMPYQPLFANLGIAQVVDLVLNHKLHKVFELLDKLDADGLIIHINPLQEWLQPEGDKYYEKPIDIIKSIIDKLKMPIIIKEVGQGMGKKSLAALFSLPLEAIDFGANGGTNFSLIELNRSSVLRQESFNSLAYVGHSAEEMVEMTNDILQRQSTLCQKVIISGGVKGFLDGYYLMKKCKAESVYAQASGFLKHSMGEYEALQAYVNTQIEGLKIAYQLLEIKE